MSRLHSRRARAAAPIASKHAELEGKTVLVIGNPYRFKIDAEEIESHGAKVNFAESYIGGYGLSQERASRLGVEISRQPTKPDAVIIYHPAMGEHEGAFNDNPALQLARKLREIGIPTLIADIHGIRDQAEGVAVKESGAHYLDMMTANSSRISRYAQTLTTMLDNIGRTPTP